MRKTYTALAALDFSDIPSGVLATDVLLKRSPVAFVRSGTITHGRYLTLFGGTTAAVEEAMEAALERGQSSVLDSVLLPDVHPEVYAAVFGARQAVAEGTFAVIETSTVPATLRAAEAALKGTAVRLVELRLADSGLAGKGVSVYRGELHDVEAAVELALAALRDPSGSAAWRIVSAPHEATAQHLLAGTAFAASRLLELPGEEET
jgi:microcompartment protein CcmL/EutN